MDSRNDKDPKSEPLSEREKRILSAYGKLPRKVDVLGHHLQKRTYFDSGDFAVSATKKTTNTTAAPTDRAHPLRGDISVPNCPVPGTSNVDKDANHGLRASTSPLRRDSVLRQHTDVDTQRMTENSGKPSKQQ